MPRKGHVKKRVTSPDPKFQSQAISKFINCLMIGGKKSIAERIMYGALDLAAQRLGMEPVDVFEKAMANVRPVVEVRPRRVGGATYQVPVEVEPDRAQALAIRWIIGYARSRKGIPMVERLARELSDACKGEGGAVKKKEDTHRMAEANRAFAHYRW
ncbi:30S ribosomal protein S7 [Thermanaerovibrio acidaminovorans]|jgi:small subunit ribosomal protein S7|uniref:Small ribosomal subunit protein uS7 n=1 Tax=Thermanaerovibrio acidaminovorans (strain ATCC 49978 / DSM 6589 / Su883) TaxID=525903 RepID=D1B5X9_THEAS|nr:30S ribosomal protein S7 [Thermanaerovibrio acidaminovorans]ACZ19420.1 ribosomal protein S7 [Thermanaerovibrio acidaminovorans DSM 6589]